MNRRAFLHAAAGLAGAAALAGPEPTLPPRPASRGWIDTNVSLGDWPFRRMPTADPTALAAALRHGGVTEAWAGTLDGLLHKDLGAANQRLAEACRASRGLLRPFGSINPMLPAWERDLDRCVTQHHMPGVRLHPNYHGYPLTDPSFARLLAAATERRLPVQIAVLMEDERMMHPRLRVAPVDIAPLAAVMRLTPGARVMLLNALGSLRGTALRSLLEAGDVGVEIATLEGVGALGSLLPELPPGRVMFGSHSPQFYFEAAALKLVESELDVGLLAAVRWGNAARFIGAGSPTGNRS